MEPRKFHIFTAIISITLGLTTTPSRSTEVESCPTITLDQETPHHAKIWNQGDEPKCSVYAATYLANLWIQNEWNSTEDLHPDPFYDALMSSPDVTTLLDAELGRTCQAARFILEGLRQKSGQSQLPLPNCKMFGLKDSKSRSYSTLESPETFLRRMQSHLEAKSPFGIEFCSGTFTRPEKQLFRSRVFQKPLTYLNEDSAKKNLNRKCGFHAAVVTGQQYRNGQCYFRVRNSKGIEHDHPDIQDGYYWIPTRDLATNTLRIITLEKTNP